MKRIAWHTLWTIGAVLLLMSPVAPARGAHKTVAAEGTLMGEIVAAPEPQSAAGVLYLRNGEGYVLRVVAAKASVSYDAGMQRPAEKRVPARRALVPGTEVKVSALLDEKSGEWTASRVVVTAMHAPTPVQTEVDDEDDDGDDSWDGAATTIRRTI